MANAGPGARRHATSSFTVSESEYADMQHAHGLPPPSLEPQRTRRGSFVQTIPYLDAGPHNEPGFMVHVQHSHRTATQLEHLAAVDESLSTGAHRARTRERMEASRNEYQTPDYPAPPGGSGHRMRVQSFTADPSHGFQAIGAPQTFVSGDFSAREEAQLKKMDWPGTTPEQRNHSEPRWAMARRAESVASTPGFHQVEGGLDMCTTCRTGLARTVAQHDGEPVLYSGREPFGSQMEWESTPGHLLGVPDSSITRVRPETVMTPDLQQDHVAWAQVVHARRMS